MKYRLFIYNIKQSKSDLPNDKNDVKNEAKAESRYKAI